MGQAVTAACEAAEGVEVGACIDMGDSLPDALEKCDAVIDFSFHTFTEELVDAWCTLNLTKCTRNIACYNVTTLDLFFFRLI